MLRKFADIDADRLDQALDALIPWNMKRRLEIEAPTHFEAPTGNRHPIEYDGPGAPALSIRVQELYGLKETPLRSQCGQLPLNPQPAVPAHRPIPDHGAICRVLERLMERRQIRNDRPLSPACFGRTIPQTPSQRLALNRAGRNS